jgi:predicted dehydrogenase
MEPVRVILVGVRGYGSSYVHSLLSRDGSNTRQLVGVVDPAAAPGSALGMPREIRARKIPAYDQLQAALVETKPDLTIISSPLHLHAAQTCDALAHGSSVLCEKPLAATAAEALYVVAESERRRDGRFVAIGYQWSFTSAVQALKRDVMAGVLGKPIRFRTAVTFPRGENYYRRNEWAGRLTTDAGEPVFDGPINNATAHFLHNMLYVLGPTRETSAFPAWVEAELYRANPIESYDTAALRCMTESGVELLFYTTHATPRRAGPMFHFEFERATVDYDDSGGGRASFLARFADGSVRDYGQPEAEREEKVWQCIDAVRTGKPVACGPRASLPHALCVSAAHASSPIRDFPESLKRRSDWEESASGGDIIWVDGLADAMADCFKRAVLPSERGLDWAATARRISASLPAEKINAAG